MTKGNPSAPSHEAQVTEPRPSWVTPSFVDLGSLGKITEAGSTTPGDASLLHAGS